METASASGYKFKGFEVDVTRRLLRGKDGVQIPLTSRVFDLLLYLVENPGRTITKDELLSAVWAGTIGAVGARVEVPPAQPRSSATLLPPSTTRHCPVT